MNQTDKYEIVFLIDLVFEKFPLFWPFWLLVLVVCISGRVWLSDFHGKLHVMKSGLEEAGRSKVLTHHSGYLQGKRWNREAERKSTGKG